MYLILWLLLVVGRERDRELPSARNDTDAMVNFLLYNLSLLWFVCVVAGGCVVEGG